MKGFEANNCRLCSKTFCCVNCRILHEKTFHNVNPECEICIYGRTSVKNISVTLLNHIRTTHWPLHCVFCKQMFTSLENLVLHNKCVLRQETIKMEATPKTPITDKPSPEVTPFYKIISEKVGATMGATSTPLVHKQEDDKITPINQSEIIAKSSLKLAGSSNLSDSKKSDRKVTFSETPSVSEFKKAKYLPLPKQIKDQEEEISTDLDETRDQEVFKDLSNEPNVSSTYEEEEYKTAPHMSSEIEEKENVNPVKPKDDTSNTLWESALGSEPSGSNIIANIASVTNYFNVSHDISVFNTSTVETSRNDGAIENRSTIWSSVTHVVRRVMHNISLSAQNSSLRVGMKRSLSHDVTDEEPSYKRMKIADLKCRRPLRYLSPLQQIRLGRLGRVDKATQTDANRINATQTIATQTNETQTNETQTNETQTNATQTNATQTNATQTNATQTNATQTNATQTNATQTQTDWVAN